MKAFLENDSPGAVYLKAFLGIYFVFGVINFLYSVFDNWHAITFLLVMYGAVKSIFAWPFYVPVSLAVLYVAGFAGLATYPAIIAFDRSLSRDRAAKYRTEMAQAKAERDRLAGDCEQKAGELERLRAELADTQQRERLLMFQRDADGGQQPRYESAAGRMYETEPEILEPEPRDPIDELYGE